ncbi:MFS transporter [Luminiphilus sp.]|jgi:predicted MFS family arabinose efflux permease|nr:MFS transporter [Luminiphilus sp.]MDC6471543.1 MFS transporter [Luminiphilus sp.]
MTKKAREDFSDCREKRQIHRSALADQRFRRYYPASWFSSLGAWLLRFLLGWSAWELTHSATWVGIVGALMLAPALLLSPWFGILSDRVNPQRGLQLSMVLHNVIALAGALTTYWDLYDRVALTLLATTLGIATSLHSPMRLAMVPLLVAREALPSAVGYSAMSFNIARMIGPALGAMLVAQVDTVAAWLTAMVLFSVSFWRLSLLTVELNRPVSAETSYLSQFMEGARHLTQRADLRLLLALTALNGLLGRTLIELLPALSGQILNGGSSELAILVAMAGLGSVLGGLLVSRQAADLGRLLLLVCMAIALSSATLVILRNLSDVVSLAIWVSWLSVATTVAGTGCQTLIQLSTLPDFRGRVMSVWTMLAMGAPALGAAVLGAGADGFGFDWVSTVAGILGMCLVAIFYARRTVVLAAGAP